MISILMPIYNGIEFIHESVPSILEQTYDKWELLIGINGHPENSEIYKTAKSFEEKSDKIKVIDFYNIKGKSNTLNEMIKYCKYNYVALLDVDDIWHPQKLEVQSVWLNSYDVIGSNCIWFGDRPGIVPSIPQHDFSNFNFSNVNPVINSSVVVRKNLCSWDSKFDGLEDYDLWIRLRLKNKRFYNCPQILVKHRIHNTSAFNSGGKNNNSVPYLLEYHKLVREENKTIEQIRYEHLTP
jgi:glycosyltransferase involved in cell wall biosynthesis